jgi:hypothetical protein
MSSAKTKHAWSKLSALGALVLGTSLAQVAQADRAQAQPVVTPETSQAGATSQNEVAVRMHGDSVYIVQSGGAFEELRLGDTPEARHLRQLLREAGALQQPISIPIGAMIVASGGGSGKGEKPKGRISTDGQAAEPKSK